MPEIELKPESDTKFFYDGDRNKQIELEVDNSAIVIRVWNIHHRMKKMIEKL